MIAKTVKCKRKKSTFVSDNATHAQEVSNFCINFTRNSAKGDEKTSYKCIENPGSAMGIRANIGYAALSKTPSVAQAAIPDVITLYYTGKWLNFGRFA